MKAFIILACVILAVTAKPLESRDGYAGNIDVTQDTVGNYRYVVQTKDFSRYEERFADGSVVGEYTYIDSNGIAQTMKYTSGKDGFRILEGPFATQPQTPVAALPSVPETLSPGNSINLPVMVPSAYAAYYYPEDTPEIKAAKDLHFAEHSQQSKNFKL